MIEMKRAEDKTVSMVLKAVKTSRRPCLLVINKIDTGPREAVLGIMESYNTRYPFESMIPISALRGDGVDILLRELRSHLQTGPRFFPEDMATDQQDEFRVSEIIREKLYLYLQRELPYSSAVTVTSMESDPERKVRVIAAKIRVEKASQKGIVIGEQGRMIKAIGRAARMDLEGWFGGRVFLELSVGVEKDWTRDSRALRRLGY
jgi:GTP-binding protein Era